MKYVKQHFVTGMKVSLPEVLNRMEDGIAAACGAAVEGIGSVTTGDTPAAGIPGRQALPDSAQGRAGAAGRKGRPRHRPDRYCQSRHPRPSGRRDRGQGRRPQGPAGGVGPHRPEHGHRDRRCRKGGLRMALGTTSIKDRPITTTTTDPGEGSELDTGKILVVYEE